MKDKLRFHTNWLVPTLSAAMATPAFYLLIGNTLRGTKFFELLAERGPLQYVTVFFTFWVCAALIQRMLQIRVQNKVWKHKLIPEGADRITPDNAQEITKHIEKLPDRASQSLLGQRLLRGLESSKSGHGANEIANSMEAQADIDSRNSSIGFSTVKVLLAAIPILGFIGTVLGIGSAVGGFGQTLAGASELGAIKDSLGHVTGGLSVAFDTTLLALTASVILMLPVSFCQQAEERMLSKIDDFVSSEFVIRIECANPEKGTASEPIDGANLKLLSDAISQNVAQMQTSINGHTEALYGWGNQLIGSLNGMQDSLTQTQEWVVQSIDQSNESARNQAEQLLNLYSEHSERLPRELTEVFQANLSNLSQSHREVTSDLHDQVREILAQQKQETQNHIQSLADSNRLLTNQMADWQTRESSATAGFEKRSNEILEQVRASYSELVEPQQQIATSLASLAEQTTQQTAAYRELIPWLSTTAAEHLKESRSYLEDSSLAYAERITALVESSVKTLEEQARQNNEILRQVVEHLPQARKTVQERPAIPVPVSKSQEAKKLGNNGSWWNLFSWGGKKHAAA